MLIDEGHGDKVGTPAEDENAMLDETAYPREGNSRLSCQIIVSDDLEGLSVTVAPYQR